MRTVLQPPSCSNWSNNEPATLSSSQVSLFRLVLELETDLSKECDEKSGFAPDRLGMKRSAGVLRCDCRLGVEILVDCLEEDLPGVFAIIREDPLELGGVQIWRTPSGFLRDMVGYSTR